MFAVPYDGQPIGIQYLPLELSNEGATFSSTSHSPLFLLSFSWLSFSFFQKMGNPGEYVWAADVGDQAYFLHLI